MHKKWWTFFVTLFATAPLALADIGDTFSRVFSSIISIGNLSWLGISPSSVVVGFTRLLIWILVFTIFYAVIHAFGQGKRSNVLGFLNKNQGMIVSAVLATMSAIFLPPALILGAGAGWATLVAFVLIGGPIVGIALLLWQIPGKGKKDTKATVFLKLVIVGLLFWILSSMKYHIGVLS